MFWGGLLSVKPVTTTRSVTVGSAGSVRSKQSPTLSPPNSDASAWSISDSPAAQVVPFCSWSCIAPVLRPSKLSDESRKTESSSSATCRFAKDFVPTYDARRTERTVLPSIERLTAR